MSDMLHGQLWQCCMCKHKVMSPDVARLWHSFRQHVERMDGSFHFCVALLLPIISRRETGAVWFSDGETNRFLSKQDVCYTFLWYTQLGQLLW